MNIITPPTLNQGDAVCLISTARKVSRDELKIPVEIIESWGLKVEFGKHLFQDYNQFSGTDEQRISDFQEAINNPEIKAVICCKGGYGTTRIIDHIDFSPLIKNPKWISGYSDVTTIHNHLHTHFNICTIHAAMPTGFIKNTAEALNSLKECLFGNLPAYQIPPHPLNRTGKANGMLTGGNLSMIYSLSGTNSDIDTKGKLLFIEDLDEYLYHIDRMMQNLKKSGKLHGLAGLIVGGMSDMNDNAIPYGKSAEEIIVEAVEEYDFPVCFNFPAGHISDNRSIIMGKNAQLTVGGKCELTYSTQ